MKRRASREAAIQALYQIDIAKAEPVEAIAYVVGENNLDQTQEKFTKSLVTGVLSNYDKINSTINNIALEWDMERMAVVDRNILRLAIYEICYSDEVPPNVAANEAIELGRTFGTEESGRFINGILGKVLAEPDKYKNTRQETGV